MTWGMTACLDPDGRKGKSPDALIYGVRKTGLANNSLVLAPRSCDASIDRFDAWTFYCGEEFLDGPLPRGSAPLANGMVNEFSVECLDDRRSDYLGPGAERTLSGEEDSFADRTAAARTVVCAEDRGDRPAMSNAIGLISPTPPKATRASRGPGSC